MNICKRILYNCFGCLLVLDFIAKVYLSISNNIFMQKKSWRISCRINKKRAFLCHVLFAIRGATVVKEGVKINLNLSYCTVHILYIYCTLFKYLSTVCSCDVWWVPLAGLHQVSWLPLLWRVPPLIQVHKEPVLRQVETGSTPGRNRFLLSWPPWESHKNGYRVILYPVKKLENKFLENFSFDM